MAPGRGGLNVPSLVLLMALVPAMAGAQWTQQGSDMDGNWTRDCLGSSLGA